MTKGIHRREPSEEAIGRERKKRVRRFAGSIALHYSLIEKTIPYYDKLQRQAACLVGRAVKGVKSPIVVDIGTGTGSTILAMLEFLPPEAIVIGLDNERDMLVQAEHRLRREIRRGQVQLIESDALQWIQRLGSKSVDGFVSGFTLHNFSAPNREILLRHAFRCLRNGGLFANADKYVNDNDDLRRDAMLRQIRRIARVFLEEKCESLLPDWIRHYIEDQERDRRMCREAAMKQMRRCGFSNISLTAIRNMEAVLVAEKGST